MDQFERGAKGKTEAAQEVVKGGDDEMSPADLRREAAIAAKNQAGEEQPAGEPPIVVDVPLPGGVESPGVVTENQSLAPEEGTSPPLVVPLDDDDQDEDDDPDAASDFKAGPNPASKNLTEEIIQRPAAGAQDGGSQQPDSTDMAYVDVWERHVTGYSEAQGQVGPKPGVETATAGESDANPGINIEDAQVWKAPAGIEVNTITDTTGSMGGTLNAVHQEGAVDSSGHLDDDATTTNVMPGDNVTIVLPDQRVISGDYDNMQAGAEAAHLERMEGSKLTNVNTTDGTDGDVWLRSEPASLVGDEVVFAREESGIGLDAAQRIDGDPDRPIVMPGDNVTVVLPDQRVISGDYDNMQAGAEAGGLDGAPTANFAWQDDTFDLYLRDDPGVSRLVGDEIVFAREEPGIGLEAAQRIDGDPDRPIVMENPTGNLTPSEQRKWDDISNTAEPQPIEPPVTSFTGFGSYEAKTQAAGDAPGEAMIDDRPLEFIIGDMMPGNGATSSENATDDTSPDQFDDLPLEPILGQYPTGNFAEQSTANADQPLEFKATSGIDDEREVDEMTTLGEHNDVALGGPDTSSRLVGLPEVPHVADGSQVPGEVDTTMHLLESMESTGDTLVDPAADPLGMTKADILTAISVEPDTYDQPDTTMSSLDEDDDDPFDGL